MVGQLIWGIENKGINNLTFLIQQYYWAAEYWEKTEGVEESNLLYNVKITDWFTYKLQIKMKIKMKYKFCQTLIKQSKIEDEMA